MGVDVVIHCASAPFRDEQNVDVLGSRRLVEAVGDRHLVYVSIVGIDRVPTGYYRAKLAAEAEIARAPKHTIARITQFHPFVAEIAAKLACSPVVPLPAAPLQPIDVADAALALADHAEGGPAGRVVDLGGPEVVAFDALARRWLARHGYRRLFVPLPLFGATGRGLAEGGLTCPDGRRGVRTFDSWLADS